jgi:hypothetical protein
MSSTKKLITPFRLMENASTSATITGSQVTCAHQDSAVVFVEWSGTSHVGVLGFEFLETDADRNSTKAPVWKAVDFGQTIAISGNSGSHQIVFTTLPFFALRPVYTRTSGTGTITVTFAAKEG